MTTDFPAMFRPFWRTRRAAAIAGILFGVLLLTALVTARIALDDGSLGVLRSEPQRRTLIRWSLGRVPFAATVMADLRADTASEVPTRRFFARFVLALGEVRAAGDGQDEATPPDSIELDAVQLAFITRRLHADVALMVPGGVEKLKRAGPRTGRTTSHSRRSP